MPGRPDVAAAAQAGGPKRVDFNGDGYEDILWRYYGTGGYNRVWYLGSAEGGAQPLGAADAGMTALAGKSQRRAEPRSEPLTGPRDMGLTSKRKGGAPAKDPEALMGGIDRRNMGSAMVQDPRQAGGGDYEFSRTLVTDPRQVAATGEPLGAAPLLLGGADVLPVGDPNWQIVGAADFDNDTQTDILWRNVSTGQNVLWFMNGTDWSVERRAPAGRGPELADRGDRRLQQRHPCRHPLAQHRRRDQRRLVHERGGVERERGASGGRGPGLADRGDRGLQQRHPCRHPLAVLRHGRLERRLVHERRLLDRQCRAHPGGGPELADREHRGLQQRRERRYPLALQRRGRLERHLVHERGELGRERGASARL